VGGIAAFVLRTGFERRVQSFQIVYCLEGKVLYRKLFLSRSMVEKENLEHSKILVQKQH